MAIKTKPTRKSRSYLNPVHRQDILAKAGAVSVPYRTAVKEVQHRVIEYVRAAYRSNPGFLTNHEDIDRLTALMAPALAAGQMQIADLTNAHLANLFHLENPPAVDVSKYGRPGVSRETELSRPFWTAIKAARQGKSVDEALAIGMRRMEKMLDTDFQMAKVIQSREALKAGGVQQYSRVAGPKACWLCSIAATQIYFTEDLLPIHANCSCDIAPVPPGGQKTLDDVLNPEKLLAESDDQIKLMTAKVESGATPAELRELVAVREHGETGPTLTWAHQKFTGPDDLPVPPSKEVLSQQVWETVRANGGITIDLAGNQPADGYAYAPYKTTEFKVPEAEFTPQHVSDYIDSHHKELAEPGNNLGMWVQDGYVYLDVSQVGPPNASTLAKAQSAQQLAVFDLGHFKEIQLGTIDAEGTYHDVGSPAGIYRQHRREVARADEGVRARRAGEVPEGEGRSGTGSAARPPVEKQNPPDGLDHDEYGDRIWRLDGKVYDSRIDYENALGAKMVAEREAQKTAEVNGVPLYLDGVDPKGRKEIERAVKELTDKYPDGGLREVTTPRPDERSDPYDVAWTSGSKTITVNADREHFGNSEKFQEGEKRDRTTGYHPKLKRWSAEKATIYHEFGHVLDYQGLEVTHRQANKALKVAFLEDNPSFKKLKRGDPKLHAAYQKWLEDGLSSYSFQGGWKSLPGLKPARLNIGEAIAEAFTDVECNGDKASRPAQVLHDLVVKNAKPEAVQAERDRRTAEWQRKMHSDTSFKQAAKTPDEKAAAAEAKRVAAEQKKAARAVKAAEKRAEEAGQLFDPKIFGDKPKLPRESLESITSRFGGTDWAATTPIQKGKPRHSKKTGELLPPQNDWNATWALLPPIEVDMDGNIVDHALERNLWLVMESAAKHPWVIEAGDRWYPDYMKFVLHQWEMAGRRNPLTGKLMTFEQAMDASGAYAIDAGWNETMALYHNWQIGKPNPKDKKRNRYADEAASMNASLTGGRWYERAKVHESEKINDFTLNGKGNLWTSTTDRVVSRLALGTDDSEFAAGLLKAGFAGSYVDPKTGETVKLNGYERISRAIDRVAIQMGAPNPAAGQARMWIEFFGPEAACGLPPDDVVAEGLVSINEWTRQQVRDKIPGIDNVLPQWVSDILRTRGQKYKVKPLKLKL